MGESASFTSRRRTRKGLALLAGVLLCPVATYYYWTKIEYRFTSVAEGEVYRSGAMPPEKLVERTREHGIRTVIDLRTPREDVEQERQALTEIGVTHVSIPSGMVPEPEVVDAFLEVMDQPDNRPILIHCNHGIGRAGLFSALYRIEYEGWSNEEARSAAYWGSGLGSFEPDSKRGRFLLEYAPRRSRATPPRPGEAELAQRRPRD